MRAIPEYYFLLRELHRLIRPARYLEIGVQYGESLALAAPETRAVGVDPRPEIRHALSKNTDVFTETSETFFATRTRKSVFGDGFVDLAFIDGMHLFESALDDFIHIERWAETRSLIVIHDTVPTDELAAQRERRSRVWTGDVYKLVLCLKRFRPDLALCNLDVAPSSLCIVGNPDPCSEVLAERRDEIVREFIRVDYDSIVGERDGRLGVRPCSDEEIAAFLAGLWNEPKSKIMPSLAQIHLEVRDEFYEKLQLRCAGNHALLEDQRKTLDGLQQTVAKRDVAIERFKLEREALLAKVRSLEERGDRFRKAAELQKELRDAVAKRDVAIERFRREREALLAKIRSLEERGDRFRKAAELQKELRDAVAKRDVALDRIRREKYSLTEKNRRINLELRKNAAQLKELGNEMEKCRQAIEWRDRALEKTKQHVDELTSSLAKHRAAIDKRDAALVKHKTMLLKQDDMIQKCRTAIAKRDDWLAEDRAIIDKQRNELRLLDESLARLRRSGSYRIGRLITYLPRKLRNTMRQLHRDNARMEK